MHPEPCLKAMRPLTLPPKLTFARLIGILADTEIDPPGAEYYRERVLTAAGILKDVVDVIA